LVNNHKVTIQVGTWKTLSMTVSIFSAVMIYTVISKVLIFLLELIFGEFGETSEATTIMAIFFLMYTALNAILYFSAVKSDPSTLQAVGVLSAHIVGFSALFAFAAMQEHPPFESSWLGSVVVVLIAAFLFVCLSAANERLRLYVCRLDGKVDETEEHWLEQTEDVENDVVSFCLGFLIMQTIRHAITGKAQPHEPAVPPSNVSQSNTNVMLLASILCILATLAVSKASQRARDRGDLHPRINRSLNIFQNVSAMCMAWCLLFWGEWQLYTWGFDHSRMFCVLLLALKITMIALVLILVVDILADHLEVGKGKRAMRSLELALGMLIGFSWEKAFDVAVEGIVEHAGENGMPVWLVEGFLVTGSLLAVVPAWKWYILPKTVDK